MRLNRTIAPDTSALDLDEVRSWLKLSTAATASDDWIEDYLIPSVDAIYWEHTRRALLEQTWEIWLDRDEVADLDLLQLYPHPLAPLQSVEDIESYDTDDVSTTMSTDDYHVRIGEHPMIRSTEDGGGWPTDLRQYEAVCITVVLGYGGDITDIPVEYRTTLRLLASFLATNPGKGVLESVSGLHDVNDFPAYVKDRLNVDRLVWAVR